MKAGEDLYERLMEARDLLWEAAMELRRLERKPDPQAEVETFDEMNMSVVHRLLETP
jgi:hypothetical protein